MMTKMLLASPDLEESGSNRLLWKKRLRHGATVGHAEHLQSDLGLAAWLLLTRTRWSRGLEFKMFMHLRHIEHVQKKYYQMNIELNQDQTFDFYRSMLWSKQLSPATWFQHVLSTSQQVLASTASKSIVSWLAGASSCCSQAGPCPWGSCAQVLRHMCWWLSHLSNIVVIATACNKEDRIWCNK